MTIKKLNRFVSALIICAITVSLLPPNLAFANYQLPVTDLLITPREPIQGTAYNLELGWTRPQPSTRNNNAAGPGDPTTHRATNYDITYRNTTSGRPDSNNEVKATVPTNGTVDQEKHLMSNLPLQSGSIYAFMVNPYHTDDIPQVGGGTQPTRSTIDGTATQPQDYLFLSDIRVSAVGEGDKLTVTWDNPTYRGNPNTFSGYNIYYSLLGAGSTPVGGVPRYVPMSETTVTQDGRLQVTITDSELRANVGKFYAVKVEPVSQGSEVRNLLSIYIGTNTRPYGISYSNRAREYRTNEAFIKPYLYAEAQNQDSVRLYWDKFPQMNGNAPLNKVIIYYEDDPAKLDKNNFSGKEMGQLAGASAASINYWSAEYPEEITYYKVVAYYNVPTTDPGYRADDPSTWVIEMETTIAYYDPTFNDFQPYMPSILDIKDNGGPAYALDVIWKAFLREAYNQTEESGRRQEFENLYVDKDVFYDVWITDDIMNLSDPAFMPYTVTSSPLSAAALSEVTKDFSGNDLPTLGYQYSFSQYYAKTDTGYERKAITDNKVYYVKIQAVRYTALTEERSQAGQGSWFIVPGGDISANPNMMNRPPLRIKKDADGVDMITDVSITIQWDTRWFEVYDAATDNWYSKIGIAANSDIIYGDAADACPKVFLLNEEKYFKMSGKQVDVSASRNNLITLLKADGANATQADTLPLRLIDLDDAEYEVHVVEYDYMLENGTYEEYLASLLPTGDPATDAERDALWRAITGRADAVYPYSLDSEISTVDAPAKGAMKPNTAYVIFFRPYFEKDGKKVAHYPAYVTGTTLDQRGPIDVVPVVPQLTAVSSTETTVTVWWPVSEALEYELAYSDLQIDYPDKGTVIPWSELSAGARPVTRKDANGNDVAGLEYTVPGLFPNTVHYFWIRSSADNVSGKAWSGWSNPVSMSTKDMAAPEPPKGLGPASKDDLAAYNKENKLELVPVGSDYMIIQWMRVYADVNNTEGDTAPAATADVKGGAADLLTLESLLGSYLLRFSDLIPNKQYYIRAKTVMTITQDGDGLKREFNYVVQVSESDKFVDVIEVTVPPLVDVPEGTKSIRKESEWTTAIFLYTGKSTDGGGDFDGDKNPDQYPLPALDFERTVDPATKSDTFRFRSDGTGADGLKDNSVDQRFISRLVANKTFTYDIDVTPPRGAQVFNHYVEMPYSIYKAFEERKINLRVKSGDTTVTLAPGALATAAVKALPGFGAGATVKLGLKMNAVGTPALTPEQNYATLPQQLSVQVITPAKTVALDVLAKPAVVGLKLDKRYSVLEKHMNGYLATGDTGGWQPLQSKYDNAAGTTTMETIRLGHYSAIARNAPVTVSLDASTGAMYTVTSRLNITDLKTYDPNRELTANEFNNLVTAVTYNRPSVAMSAGLPQADFENLGKAGMLVSGTNVPKAVGMKTVVRLYELKTKSAVKGYPALAEAQNQGIASADPALHASLLKAEYIGLLGPSASLSGNLTLGEMMSALAIVLEDAAP